MDIKCNKKQTLLTSYFKVEIKSQKNGFRTNPILNQRKIRKKQIYYQKILKKYALHHLKRIRIKKYSQIKLILIFRSIRTKLTTNWKQFYKNHSVLFTYICIDIFNKYTSELWSIQEKNVVNYCKDIDSIQLHYINRRLKQIMLNIGIMANDDGITNSYSLTELQNKRYKSNKQTDNARLLIVSDTKEKDTSKFFLTYCLFAIILIIE